MEITDIKIKHTNDGGRMRAAVSVVFDSAFAVHDIKVIEGQDKLFLAMPSKSSRTALTGTSCTPLTVKCASFWRTPYWKCTTTSWLIQPKFRPENS